MCPSCFDFPNASVLNICHFVFAFLAADRFIDQIAQNAGQGALELVQTSANIITLARMISEI